MALLIVSRNYGVALYIAPRRKRVTSVVQRVTKWAATRVAEPLGSGAARRSLQAHLPGYRAGQNGEHMFSAFLSQLGKQDRLWNSGAVIRAGIKISAASAISAALAVSEVAGALGARGVSALSTRAFDFASVPGNGQASGDSAPAWPRTKPAWRCGRGLRGGVYRREW